MVNTNSQTATRLFRICIQLLLVFCLIFWLTAAYILADGKKRREVLPAINDSTVAAKGQQLFQANCATCHNFKQKGIGPSLGRVASEVPADWLKKFIQNAPGVIERGDARANQLYAEYKQLMPAYPQLKEAELNALVVYIKANQQKADRKSLAPDGLKDPIPARIKSAGLVLTLDPITTAPASAQRAPLARINKTVILPGKQERVFIQDLRGKLYELVDNDWRVMLDMAHERPNFIPSPGLATGLGSFAFHPEFYQNGLLYTTHTEKAHSAKADFNYADSIKVTLQWVLTEWQIKDPNATSFEGIGRELLRIDMVSSIHGMQDIAFNPNARKGSEDYGLLYIGIGDGGATENGYYFLCNGRNRPWSSVLRIDPKGRNSRNGKYGIPAVNPFAADKDESTIKEIFVRGFRNPNRFWWTTDGKMLISDIGQSQAEEINLAKAGADYGWPEREGTFVINHRGRMDQVYALPANDATLGYTYPVAQYDHDEGKAISGGFVYTGKEFPELTNKYIFGDINNGRVFMVDSKQLQLGRQVPIEELTISVNGAITSFQAINGKEKPDLRLGLGAKGALYIFTKANGVVYQIKKVTAYK